LQLLPEDQDQLRWIPNYRGDEGLLIAPVTEEDGRPVKVLGVYITPNGKKSEHKPNRITLGARRPGLFRLGKPGPRVIEAEGLEKALAARAVGEPYVVATGGVTLFGKAPHHPKVKQNVIARDADEPGSPADQGLWRGVARRLSQGLEVTVTACPNDLAPDDAPHLKDLDDAYRYDHSLAVRLLDEAKLEHGRLGDINDNAILDEVSRFDAVALGRARKGVANCSGFRWGRSTLR
jgi:hypothetical protein